MSNTGADVVLRILARTFQILATLAAPTTTSSTADRQSQTAGRGNRRRSRSLQYLEPPLPARLRSASPVSPSPAFESCPLPVRSANWRGCRRLPRPHQSRRQTHRTPRSGLAADPGRLRRLATHRRRSRREPRPVLCLDRKSTRLNSSHSQISYAVFCLKKKKTT